MITVYSDRIEILSKGGLAPLQTKAGFFRGHSVPVNENYLKFSCNCISVKKREEEFPLFRLNTEKGRLISPTATSPSPFHSTSSMRWGDKMDNKTEEHGLNDSQTRVLAKIRNNPNITKKELAVVCHLGRTSIDNTVAVLKKRGFIERIGSNKSGYWKAN